MSNKKANDFLQRKKENVKSKMVNRKTGEGAKTADRRKKRDRITPDRGPKRDKVGGGRFQPKPSPDGDRKIPPRGPKPAPGRKPNITDKVERPSGGGSKTPPRMPARDPRDRKPTQRHAINHGRGTPSRPDNKYGRVRRSGGMNTRSGRRG